MYRVFTGRACDVAASSVRSVEESVEESVEDDAMKSELSIYHCHWPHRLNQQHKTFATEKPHARSTTYPPRGQECNKPNPQVIRSFATVH